MYYIEKEFNQYKLIQDYNNAAENLNKIYDKKLPILSSYGQCNGLSAYWIFSNLVGGERLKHFNNMLDLIANNTPEENKRMLEGSYGQDDSFQRFFRMINQLQLIESKDIYIELSDLIQSDSFKVINQLYSDYVGEVYDVYNLAVKINKNNIDSQMNCLFEEILNKGKLFRLTVPEHVISLQVLDNKKYKVFDPNKGEIICENKDDLKKLILDIHNKIPGNNEDNLILTLTAISQNKDDAEYFPDRNELNDLFYDNEITNEDLSTTFIMASYFKDFETMNYILDNYDGFEINYGNNPNFGQDSELIEKLLEYDPKLVCRKFGKNELNILQVCIKEGYFESAKKLIDSQIFPFYDYDCLGNTSYDLANEYGYKELADKIYESCNSNISIQKVFDARFKDFNESADGVNESIFDSSFIFADEYNNNSINNDSDSDSEYEYYEYDYEDECDEPVNDNQLSSLLNRINNLNKYCDSLTKEKDELLAMDKNSEDYRIKYNEYCKHYTEYYDEHNKIIEAAKIIANNQNKSAPK